MARREKIHQIADACGVDAKTVRNALVSAGLTVGRGGYDFDKAVAAVNAIADPARIAGHAVTRGGGNTTWRSPAFVAVICSKRFCLKPRPKTFRPSSVTSKAGALRCFCPRWINTGNIWRS